MTNTGNTTQAFDVRLLATTATNARPAHRVADLHEAHRERLRSRGAAGQPAGGERRHRRPGRSGLDRRAEPARHLRRSRPGETIQVTLRSFSTLAEARTLATDGGAGGARPRGIPGARRWRSWSRTTPRFRPRRSAWRTRCPSRPVGGTGTLTWDVAGRVGPARRAPDRRQPDHRDPRRRRAPSPSRSQLTDEARSGEPDAEGRDADRPEGRHDHGALGAVRDLAPRGDRDAHRDGRARGRPDRGRDLPRGRHRPRDGCRLAGPRPSSPRRCRSARTTSPPATSGTETGSSPVRPATVQVKVRTLLRLTTDPPRPSTADRSRSWPPSTRSPAGAPAPTVQAQFYDDGSLRRSRLVLRGSGRLATRPSGRRSAPVRRHVRGRRELRRRQRGRPARDRAAGCGPPWTSSSDAPVRRPTARAVTLDGAGDLPGAGSRPDR